MLAYVLGLVGIYLYLACTMGTQNVKCPMQLGPRQGLPLSNYQQKTLYVDKYIKARVEAPSQNIPYNIFQTNEVDQIPLHMKHSINTIVMKNPQYTYRFFNSTERRTFIKENMGDTVLDCYDKLNPLAYKADLFRYSAVYTFGGCYMDIGFVAVDSLSDFIRPGYNFVSSENAPPDFALNSAFFCATSKHKILQNTINLLVKNINQEYRGRDAIDVTGPWRFIVGFKEYFQIGISLVIETREYIDGIFLLHRFKEEEECMMSTIQDNSGKVLFYNKYPNYYEDMDRNTKTPHYGVFWSNQNVYKKQIQPLKIETFNVATSLRPNNQLPYDSMIPIEYQN